MRRRWTTQARRQVLLSACGVGLAVVAVAAPVRRGDLVDATQFSIAFFATLLTGEAVVFALTFAAASSWPSLREIDNHIAFREWVIIGALATLFTACGLLARNLVGATFGALLFVEANIIGVFSFIRLFSLASVGGRTRLLSRTLQRALAELPAENHVVRAYLGALDQALGHSDPNELRNVVDELVGVRVPPTATEASLVLHLEVLHRLARSALGRGADPVVVVRCADSVIDSLLERAPSMVEPAAPLGALSRYLAWLGSTSLVMATRGVASPRAARELIALSTRARMRVLRLVDPDPQSVSAPDEVGSALPEPVGLLLWTRDFTEFHGSDQAGAFYGVYEILTGSKFLGNYWDGASILGRLREVLYGPDRMDGVAAETTRKAFGSVAEFDRFWTLVSVGALATLRDARLPHPPEFVRPEFTPDQQLLGAYLRTFASHRWFDRAEEAREVLLSLVCQTDLPGSPWYEVQAASRRSRLHTIPPVVNPEHRPAAMVLAVAYRLAPLVPGGAEDELRRFLLGLPEPALRAAADLARRVLPDAAAQAHPAEAVVTGLRVIQLVGAHMRKE